MKKQLIFETITELQQYIAENNISIDNLEIFEINKEKESELLPLEESISEEKIMLPEYVDIQLISLYDSPTIKAKISENNILYADDVKINPNSCMPTIINVLGRKVSVILCNEDGKTHANLGIALDNNPRYNVLFEVRKLEGESFTMEIAREMIEKKSNDN